MRRLAIGSALAVVAATIVLAQSPNAPQIQAAPPGQLSGPGVLPATPLPQKSLLPSTSVPGGVPQSTLGQPTCVTCTATPKHFIGTSAANQTSPRPAFKPANETATKIDAKASIKAKAGGLQAKSPSFPKKDEIKATAGPAEAKMQPTTVGPGRPPEKSSESGGSSGSGTPKGDSEQSAADQLKGLVPAVAGPKFPGGKSKSEDQQGAAGGQSPATGGKSVGAQGKSLGAGIGPAFSPPSTGKASVPTKADKSGSTDPAKGVEDKATAKIKSKDVPLPTSGGTISNDAKSGLP